MNSSAVSAQYGAAEDNYGNEAGEENGK